jgi:hypothetical protein
MAKKEAPAQHPVTCKASACFKVDDLLTVAAELTIVDGKVTDLKILNAANLPAASIGKAQTSLWEQIRMQRLEQ